MSDFEILKKKLDEQRARLSKAQGQMEAVTSQWLKKYNTDNVEEIRAMRDEANDELKRLTAELDSLMTEAGKLLNEAAGL